MAEMENAIFTNMCMVYDGAGNILVQNRRNPNWPGITFPGGHVEHGESFSGSVIREVKEETGLDIQRPVLCGVKQFQTKEDARYVVLFYKTDRFSGMLRSSEEGDVFWIKRSELETYSLADDFEKMLEVFESSEISEFYYSKCNGAWKAELL
ncbi:MAG: 8-oxo-dGTP diphosphatase [Christensenellaceae bacterium]|jgi:8-oxo-dGTP diphosphatase|nr:8-oxo-dGTP diphosphatase [Christensenellaceae bacterium]PWM60958.1 MAG: DNA mismatch repair protein MutT [Clostridia bacterium]